MIDFSELASFNFSMPTSTLHIFENKANVFHSFCEIDLITILGY